jgi:hypothetical protein
MQNSSENDKLTTKPTKREMKIFKKRAKEPTVSLRK